MLIIIVTIFEDEEHVFKAIKAIVNRYLLKQTPRSDNLKGIKDVLASDASI